MNIDPIVMVPALIILMSIIFPLIIGITSSNKSKILTYILWISFLIMAFLSPILLTK